MNNEVVSVAGRMNEIAGVLEQQREATAEIAQNVTQISQAAHSIENRANTVIGAVSKSEQLIDRQFTQLEKKHIPDQVLYRAKSDHLLWKKRLAEMLVGLTSLTPDELSDHHSCRLGKWYGTVNDEKLRSDRRFKELLAPHEKVHKCGKAAAAAYASGDREKALEEYNNMEAASADVMSLLDQLIARGR